METKTSDIEIPAGILSDDLAESFRAGASQKFSYGKFELFVAIGRILRSTITTASFRAYTMSVIASLTTEDVDSALDCLKEVDNNYYLNCNRLLGIWSTGCHRQYCESCDPREKRTRDEETRASFAKELVENRDDIESCLVALRAWKRVVLMGLSSKAVHSYKVQIDDFTRLRLPDKALPEIVANVLWATDASEERAALTKYIEGVTLYSSHCWWIWAVHKNASAKIAELRNLRAERHRL